MKFPMNLRGVFAGSGVEAFSNPTMAETILDLVIPNPTATNANANKNASVLYVGTATYDIPLFRDKQTNCFLEKGCTVRSLDLAFVDDGEAGDSNSNSNEKRLEFKDPAYLIEEWADVIVVSGGNTLFAVDRWQKWVVPAFRKAMDRGCVMSGGSAGAICWFDSGHSDSMDPDSYQDAMLEKYSPESTTTESTDNDDDDNKNNDDNNNNIGEEAYDGKEDTKKKWNYIRVPGLGFVPGLICCPHFDLTQSNGLLRANDFDNMLLRTGTAVLLNSKNKPNTDVVMGLGIDHYAALVVTGDSNYRIFQFEGKAGSVAEATTKATSSLDKDNDDDDDDGSRFSVDDDGTSTGVPGIWIKRVVEEENEKDSISTRKLVVKSKVCPPKGKLQDLFGLVGVSAEVADPSSSSLSSITNQTFFDDGSDPDNMHHIQLCRTENPSWNKPSSAV